MINCLSSQIDRISSFLNTPLTPEKKTGIIDSVSFNAMKQCGGLGDMLLRKGGYGDWRNWLSEKEWIQFDHEFDTQLNGVALAEPMR